MVGPSHFSLDTRAGHRYGTVTASLPGYRFSTALTWSQTDGAWYRCRGLRTCGWAKSGPLSFTALCVEALLSDLSVALTTVPAT
jgi:hypothetical protein